MNEILVVDDDPFLRESLKRLLSSNGFTVRAAAAAREGFIQIAENAPDLLILDLSLPDEDGLTLCRRIRAKWKFPIVMLTSRSDLLDKVVGLEVGADDYLTKPFEARELIARVRANLRRQTEYQPAKGQDEVIEIGPLRLDTASRKATMRENPVTLTALEFRLLHYFVANSGRVLEREALFETVWGYEEEFNSNSLDVFVYRLRTKLEKASGTKLIHTVRGCGYRFEYES
ncbi:MAG TPA: response regulator transcription factor [Fimbriimonadaceae bacterium]|nr:response regulator transcription factor [Fimbriimonadaceae bacterium]